MLYSGHISPLYPPQYQEASLNLGAIRDQGFLEERAHGVIFVVPTLHWCGRSNVCSGGVAELSIVPRANPDNTSSILPLKYESCAADLQNISIISSSIFMLECVSSDRYVCLSSLNYRSEYSHLFIGSQWFHRPRCDIIPSCIFSGVLDDIPV